MTDWDQVAREVLTALETAIRDARRIEKAERERDGFEQMAREYSHNADYYRRLVVQIGETCGRDAYVSDDGSVQQDVLCAKVPELVASMKRERDEALTALYCALHPVADRATVERVARAMYDDARKGMAAPKAWDKALPNVRDEKMMGARAALRAVGYEVAE